MVLSPGPGDQSKVKQGNKIIVQSPQPGDIGKLKKKKKTKI